MSTTADGIRLGLMNWEDSDHWVLASDAVSRLSGRTEALKNAILIEVFRPGQAAVVGAWCAHCQAVGTPDEAGVMCPCCFTQVMDATEMVVA